MLIKFWVFNSSGTEKFSTFGFSTFNRKMLKKSGEWKVKSGMILNSLYYAKAPYITANRKKFLKRKK